MYSLFCEAIYSNKFILGIFSCNSKYTARSVSGTFVILIDTSRNEIRTIRIRAKNTSLLSILLATSPVKKIPIKGFTRKIRPIINIITALPLRLFKVLFARTNLVACNFIIQNKN
jgi:hypothetical protein